MKTKILLFVSLIFLLTGCNDVLDRPQLSAADDDKYWVNENNLRYYVNEFYPYNFIGYNINWGTNYTPYIGFTFSDDVMKDAKQTSFSVLIPTTVGSGVQPAVQTTDWPAWNEHHTGPSWNFYWIRKANLMLNRMENRMTSLLTEEQYKHWEGIARFMRAYTYSGLVQVYGDVPYYDKYIENTDLDELYKRRTPRNEVMDKVYDDLKFAWDNVRLNDGDQYVNKYVIVGYIARFMLVEGTWQKYHKNDTERAKKFLSFAVEAADFLMKSGKYDIVTDFHNLFGSQDLKGNKDVVFYRHYSTAVQVSHGVASYSNLNEVSAVNANLALIKAFNCIDGKPWELSSVEGADKFDLASLIKSRDPRFEATFYYKPTLKAKASTLYSCKFISREGMGYEGLNLPLQYVSTNNTNDYPIIRYAEVLLNWIEAKAELATMGGAAVSQADIDASINVIRNRPLDAVAISRGVQKTAAMVLASLPNDPSRDGDVPALLWEIRRERRMEFFLEYSRVLDLRRWKKLNYMNNTKNPDLVRGPWVDVVNELPGALTKDNINILAVVKADGTKVVYNGTNGADLVGFYSPANIVNRDPYEDLAGVNVYLAPVGLNQITEYATKGYELSQTEGWGTGK